MAKYNGHRSWNAWNVSLWIGNDEGLYTFAQQCIHITRNRLQAARVFLEAMQECGIFQTPDGAPYTITSVREAMRGL